LLTYPSAASNYGDASRHIRAAARRTGVRLVDTAPVMLARCPKEPCPAFLYADHRPTARGHRLMARALVGDLSGVSRAVP
jgi:hypothetical protein